MHSMGLRNIRPAFILKFVINPRMNIAGNERKPFCSLKNLLLVSVMVLSTAAYSDHDHPRAGAADYSHYPQGGGLFVGATFGPDDRLWRIVPDKRHIYVDYSTDLGKTFSAPLRVNNESMRIKASGENRPGIAVDGSGKIFITFAAEGDQPVAQYFSISTDNGRSFSTPTPVSDNAAEANSFEGRLALDPLGHAYVFWLDERARTDWRQPGNAIYFRAIDNSGSANTADRKLADTVCECCRIAVAFDTRRRPVVLARFVYPGDIRDHGLVSIGADGMPLSWRVTFDEWELKGCPEHGPAISVSSDDRYHIAWFTQGKVRQGLFYAYSPDRGQHFSAPFSFGAPGRLPSHPDVMAKGKNVFITWTEFDGDRTHLLLMQSGDGGETWLPARPIAESSAGNDFPFLLAGPQGIFISWNSKKEGYRLIPIDSAASSIDR
jgi:hypothetical protein